MSETRSEVTPYSLGEEDYHGGLKRSECPYSEAHSAAAAAEWREGWDRASYDTREARRIIRKG